MTRKLIDTSDHGIKIFHYDDGTVDVDSWAGAEYESRSFKNTNLAFEQVARWFKQLSDGFRGYRND